MNTMRLKDNRKAMEMYVSAKVSTEKPCSFNCLMQLMRKAHGKAVEFRIAASPGSRVFIAGTFNNWNPTTHPLTYHPEDGLFKATLYLPSGTHNYKFVVNNDWQLDNLCPHWMISAQGILNSVVKV